MILMALPGQGAELEIMPLLGRLASDDLLSNNQAAQQISVSTDLHYGLALAWQATNSGQGQLLINKVSHDFRSSVDDTKQSIDILSGYFSGVALFRQPSYITTVTLGVGAAYFDGASDSALYPSVTIALGTRYELSKQWSIITELRAYVTLTDIDDELFCRQGVCDAQFDDALWLDTSILIGIAYRF